MKTVCAIDPGTSQSAVVIWDGTRVAEKFILPNEELIPYLRSVVCDMVACEHIASYGMPVGREVFQTCYFIGRCWQVCLDRGIEWSAVYRMEVKSFWCHSARATDANIRQAVIDRLGAPGVKANQGVTYGISKDLWSALAIAVRSHDMRFLNTLL